MTVNRLSSWRMWLPVLGGLGLGWAILAGQRPARFERIELSLKTPEGIELNGIGLLSHRAVRHPVVVWFDSGSTHGQENYLRQCAELGLAALCLKYDSTNQERFNRQVWTLKRYLQQQPWAHTNATAWVGVDSGAQRTLSFLLNQPPATHPQLLVGLATGGVAEKDWRSSLIASKSALESQAIRCPVLLVHGEKDDVYSLQEAERLASRLSRQAVAVSLNIVSNAPHHFGPDRGAVLRAVADYCRARLTLTDYAAGHACQLTEKERNSFNTGMQRAGLNRHELWRAVLASPEPERRSVMLLIGRLEDYDLAHMTASHLRELVAVAWKARRSFAWCRATPLSLFETYTIGPRAFEEPLEQCEAAFFRRLYRSLKYCHTTEEARLATYRFLLSHVRWTEAHQVRSIDDLAKEKTPRQVFESGYGDCYALTMLGTKLARCAGLCTRPVLTLWPWRGGGRHYWTEVWNTEEGRWRPYDTADPTFTNTLPWMLEQGYKKAVIQAASGNRGAWNAETEERWDAYTNTIGEFYPSGTVKVSVQDHGVAVSNQYVGVQMYTDGPVSIARARTDSQGQACFTLGKSYLSAYRIFLEGQADGPWQWVAVQSNRVHCVVLNLETKRPFNPTEAPPPLAIKPATATSP